MIKSELIKKSPVRVFEDTLGGGLGAGNIGVITARKGVGKTATLVHMAIDKLMRQQNVLHVSFSDDPKSISNWYEQVFNEVAHAYKLEDFTKVNDELVRHRLILHFKQQDLEFSSIKKHVNEVIKGVETHPDIIIVDGFDWENSEPADIQAWKDYAYELNTAIWFSATLHREQLDLDEHGVPAPVNKYYDILSVIIMLKPESTHINLELLKSQDGKKNDLKLKLDPKTLLMTNHRV